MSPLYIHPPPLHPLVSVTVLSMRFTLVPQVVKINPTCLPLLPTVPKEWEAVVTHPMVVPTSLLGPRLPLGGIFTVCVAWGTSRTNFPVFVYDMVAALKPDLAQVREVKTC